MDISPSPIDENLQVDSAKIGFNSLAERKRNGLEADPTIERCGTGFQPVQFFQFDKISSRSGVQAAKVFRLSSRPSGILTQPGMRAAGPHCSDCSFQQTVARHIA